MINSKKIIYHFKNISGRKVHLFPRENSSRKTVLVRK